MRTWTGLLMCALVAQAHAEGPRVAILPPHQEGDWSDPRAKTDRDNLVAYLSEALGTLGYTVLDDQAAAVMLESDAGLKACIGRTECKVKLAERLNVPLVLGSTFERPPTGSGKWSATVAVYSTDARRLGASHLHTCAQCDVAKLHAPVVELVGRVMADEKKRGRAKLVVRPKPTTATVLVDNEEVGRGETRVVIYADAKVVRVEGQGTTKEIVLEGMTDRTHVIEIDLASGVVAHTHSEAGGGGGGAPWMRPVGIAGVAAGVAAIGAGIALLVIDGRGTCDLMLSQQQCPQLYDTFGLGLGLTIGGGVLAALGGLLVYLGRGSAAESVALAPLVTPNAAGVVAGGRF